MPLPRIVGVTSLLTYRKLVFAKEDKVAVIFLRENKHYGAKRLLSEFPSEQWSLNGLKKIF